VAQSEHLAIYKGSYDLCLYLELSRHQPSPASHPAECAVDHRVRGASFAPAARPLGSGAWGWRRRGRRAALAARMRHPSAFFSIEPAATMKGRAGAPADERAGEDSHLFPHHLGVNIASPRVAPGSDRLAQAYGSLAAIERFSPRRDQPGRRVSAVPLAHHGRLAALRPL